ncbi:MAG TPA: hypothetical protein VFP12_09905 [Allosphingosinicella sp.]|nr:hypothetical protein [Allosphingosinicella sp.]
MTDGTKAEQPRLAQAANGDQADVTPVPTCPPPLCKQCRNSIAAGAKICATCNSYQDWRSVVPISNTALALLTALVSTSAIAAPALYKFVHTPRSEATLSMPAIDGTTLRVVALNQGDAPASVIKAWVSSEYLAGATKVRLRNDNDAILRPGSQLLTFDIVPLLDEGDSYRSSMEMIHYIIKKEPAPETEIRFHLLQSDGRVDVQAMSLDAEDLFRLLRANADRCSAIKEINFDNGCVGRGLSEKELFPTGDDKVPKGLVEEIENRLNRRQDNQAKGQKPIE